MRPWIRAWPGLDSGLKNAIRLLKLPKLGSAGSSRPTHHFDSYNMSLDTKNICTFFLYFYKVSLNERPKANLF